MRPLNYAIDLDGCLATWERSEGYEQPAGGWVDGAQDALRAILSDPDTGTVVVHTCRATWPAGGGWQAVAEFLWSGGFRVAIVTEDDDEAGTLWTLVEPPDGGQPDAPTIGIWLGRGKPIAHVYIDDRTVQFTLELGWERTVVVAKQVALGLAA